jgi:hypothetical protein
MKDGVPYLLSGWEVVVILREKGVAPSAGSNGADDLESEVGACRVTDDLNVLWLNAVQSKTTERRHLIRPLR